ncbi:hypothetical protein GF371_03090 [Candidatus Woesearchaeota archaeon]|nr:hypothetical protein [Candidatus Woesearchaeota archaeon]
MRKTSLILFIIIIVFASIHVAIFLDDLTDVTGAHSFEGREQEFQEESFLNDPERAKEINQTETDPYRFL